MYIMYKQMIKTTFEKGKIYIKDGKGVKITEVMNVKK